MKSVVTARLRSMPLAASARASRQLLDLLDDHGVGRDASVEGSAGAGGPVADLVDHLHALDHLAEHRIPPARRARIEVEVVVEVDVELARAGVRLGAAGESHGAAQVAQAV